MDVKKPSIRRLLDRLAEILRGSKRFSSLRDLIRETRLKERVN